MTTTTIPTEISYRENRVAHLIERLPWATRGLKDSGHLSINKANQFFDYLEQVGNNLEEYASMMLGFDYFTMLSGVEDKGTYLRVHYLGRKSGCVAKDHKTMITLFVNPDLPASV